MEHDLALLVLRATVGFTMAAHGFAKVFSGGKLAGTARWFDSIGMRWGPLQARLAAGTEVAAGICLAIGLATTVASAAFVALMLVAGWTVHRANGFFIVTSGWEYNLVLAVAALAIAILGPLRWSLDNRLGLAERLDGWIGLVLCAGGGLLAGAVHLGMFYRPNKTQDA